MTFFTRACALSAILTACGPDVPETSTGSSGPNDTVDTVDTAGSATGPVPTTGEADATGEADMTTGDAACAAASAAIAAQIVAGSACTAVVRLDYETFAAKGLEILCAPSTVTTEADARGAADKDTGFGQGTGLAGAEPVDEYVFYTNPQDSGGVGVVSARSGTSVFGGSIIWAGIGEITFPASFDAPEALGAGCDSVVPQPAARGWDLIPGAKPLADDAVLAALDVVWTTALPDALAGASTVLDAVVLLYPPTVGFFESSTGEWVVLINAG